MKEEIIKKEEKQNIVEKVKAIKEVGHTYENALDNNAKNTKELYDVLKKGLESNQYISEDCRKVTEKAISAYEKVIDKSTSEEERKFYCEKIEQATFEALKQSDEILESNKNICSEATKIEESNKKLTWNTVAAFGIGALATLGVVRIVGPAAYDVVKKYIEKK